MIVRSEEHTSELQSRSDLVCRLLLEKKKPAAPGPPPSPCSWRTPARRVGSGRPSASRSPWPGAAPAGGALPGRYCAWPPASPPTHATQCIRGLLPAEPHAAAVRPLNDLWLGASPVYLEAAALQHPVLGPAAR